MPKPRQTSKPLDGRRIEVVDDDVAAVLRAESGMERLRLAHEAWDTRRLPTISGETGFAEVGGLMNYGPSIPEMFRRAAAYVDKILKGAKPSDLPVEQHPKLEFVVNLKTAKALGLTITPSVLIRADQVIQ